MKTLIYIAIIISCITQVWSQSPGLFNYQGMALDQSGNVYTNQNINIRFSILENSATGSIIYQEDHQTVTSDVGIFSVQIGAGTVLSGQFNQLTWGARNYWLQVEGNFGGQGYVHFGTTQLVSVPYALHAETVSNPNDADADPNNEIQSISISGNTLTISGGNSVNLPNSGSGGSGDDDPNNEIQSITHTKNGSNVELNISLGGNGTTFSVQDEDADPQNEIQSLNITGNQLSITNGNQVDLTPIVSPWKPISDGIEFKQGNAYVRDDNPDKETRITPESVSVAFGDAKAEILPFEINLDVQGIGRARLDHGLLEFTKVKGPEQLGIYRDSIELIGASCNTNIQPGEISLEDSTQLSSTRYTKDSLEYFYTAGSLAFPDVSKLKATHLQFKTIGLGLESTMGPGAASFEDDNYVSEQTSSQFRIYNKGTMPFDRAIYGKDSIILWNEARWKNVDIKTSTGTGGSMDLFGAAGTNLVHLGYNPNPEFASLPPTGNLFLNDHLGNTRIEARVEGERGILTLQDDTTLTWVTAGGMFFGPRLKTNNLSLVDIMATIEYNSNKDAGLLQLNSGEDIHPIAFLGPDLLDPENGRLCLYNKNQEFEKFCATANEFNGGELFLDGIESPNVYAGGFADRGMVYVSDSIGFERAGMRVDDNDYGEFYLNQGRVIIKNDLLQEEVILDDLNLNFFGPNQDVASCLGKEVGMENTGILSLFGQNTNLNVTAGFDDQAGEIPDGNVGIVKVCDQEGQAQAWMNGFGSIRGRSILIQDEFNNNKFDLGNSAFDNSGVMNLYGSNGTINVSFQATNSGKNGWVGVADENGAYRAGFFIDDADNNNGKVFADIKHFRMDRPSNPNEEIWYASLEGPEAAAYVRGTYQLNNGEAFVPFPEHFKEVCNVSSITIQLTPRHWDTYGIALIKIDQDGFYVKELKGATGSFKFDWEAKGVRRGFEDYKAVVSKDEVSGILKSTKQKIGK